jgi:hypothetical protein
MSLSQTIRFPRGDTQILPFTVKDDGTTADLSGATIEWALYHNGHRVIDLSTPGVKVQNRNNANGTFEVKIGAGVTEQLSANGYDEQIRVIDSSGNRSTFDGDVRLQPTQS